MNCKPLLILGVFPLFMGQPSLAELDKSFNCISEYETPLERPEEHLLLCGTAEEESGLKVVTVYVGEPAESEAQQQMEPVRSFSLWSHPELPEGVTVMGYQRSMDEDITICAFDVEENELLAIKNCSYEDKDPLLLQFAAFSTVLDSETVADWLGWNLESE